MKVVTDEGTKELVRLELLQSIAEAEEDLKRFDKETDDGFFPKMLSDGELEVRAAKVRKLLEYYELRDRFFTVDETAIRLEEERRKGRMY